MIVLATANPDKENEIRKILSLPGIELVSRSDLAGAPPVEEDGSTLEENALKKARVLRDFSGHCALADDTGLEVDALGGSPGAFSSRFAGPGASYRDNCAKLLRDLAGVPCERRGAVFRCVCALALNAEAARVVTAALRRRGRQGGDGEAAVFGRSEEVSLAEGGARLAVLCGDRVEALLCEGIVRGNITLVPRGEGGFGYDPVFKVAGWGKTFAEMTPERKNAISHRYRALVEMAALLERLGLAAHGR